MTRVSQATFTVAGVTGWTLSNWTFDSTSYGTVTRTVNTGATTWSGVIVAEGIGKVTVSRGGSSTTIQAPLLQVTPRSGWAWTAKQPSKETWPFTTPNGSVLNPSNPPTTTSPAVGWFGLDLNNSGGSTAAISDNGPNHQFKYFSSPIDDSAEGRPTGFYWVLPPDLENTSSEFYLRQCGDYNPATQTGVFISGANLLVQAARHEAGASQSHYANYVTAQNATATNLGLIAERAVAGTSTSLESLAAQASGDLATARGLIVAATEQEPYPPNYSENNVFLGNINLSPNYANCP